MSREVLWRERSLKQTLLWRKEAVKRWMRKEESRRKGRETVEKI
jgi:hypothetical protein